MPSAGPAPCRRCVTHSVRPAGREGIGHEPLRGQLGPVKVAARDASAADAKLARHADAAPAARGVEDVACGCWRRPADRDEPRGEVPSRVHSLQRRPHRGLGRAVAGSRAARRTRAARPPGRAAIASPPHSVGQARLGRTSRASISIRQVAASPGGLSRHSAQRAKAGARPSSVVSRSARITIRAPRSVVRKISSTDGSNDRVVGRAPAGLST